MAGEEGAKTVSKTHAGQLRNCGLLPTTGNRYPYTKLLVWLWDPHGVLLNASSRQSTWGIQLTTRLDIVLKLITHGVIPPPHPPYASVAHTEATLQRVIKQNHTYKYLCSRFHDSGSVTGCSGVAAWKRVGFV